MKPAIRVCAVMLLFGNWRAADDAASVVILAADGDHFSAGHDLSLRRHGGHWQRMVWRK